MNLFKVNISYTHLTLTIIIPLSMEELLISLWFLDKSRVYISTNYILSEIIRVEDGLLYIKIYS